MPQIINTNIASLNAQRNLDKSQSANSTALERLSSGLRINSAKDDAAGLAISTRFTSQIKGLNVAIRNAGDGIALAQTAEGALGSMNDNLQRIRELAVQSANATNSDVDREALQAEVDQLVSEVTRTSEETDFNGRKLLDGSFNATFQIGANAGQTVDISIAELTADKLGVGTATGISAQGTKDGLQNGDLIINGTAIDPSNAADDTASTVDAAASSIAKVAAINAKADETGVTAKVNTNVASGAEQTLGASSGTIALNGVDIDISTGGLDAAADRNSVVASINAKAEQTGVIARDGGEAGGVILEAADGRNINVEFKGGFDTSGDGTMSDAENAAASAATGLKGGTTYGGYTLTSQDGSDINIQGGQGTGTGDIKRSGLSEGTFSGREAAITTTATQTEIKTEETASTFKTGDLGIAGTTVVNATNNTFEISLDNGDFATFELDSSVTPTGGTQGQYDDVDELVSIINQSISATSNSEFFDATTGEAKISASATLDKDGNQTGGITFSTTDKGADTSLVVRQGEGNLDIEGSISAEDGVAAETLQQLSIDFKFDGKNNFDADNDLVIVTTGGPGATSTIGVTAATDYTAESFAAHVNANLGGNAGAIEAVVADDGVTVNIRSVAGSGVTGLANTGTNVQNSIIQEDVQHLDNGDAVITDVATFAGAITGANEVIGLSVDGSGALDVDLGSSITTAYDAYAAANGTGTDYATDLAAIGAAGTDAAKAAALETFLNNALSAQAAGAGVTATAVGDQVVLSSDSGGDIEVSDGTANPLDAVANAAVTAGTVNISATSGTATTGSFNVAQGIDGIEDGTFITADADGPGTDFKAQANPLVINSENNTFTIAVDGGAETNITIADGSYNKLSDLVTTLNNATGAGSLNAAGATVAIDPEDSSKLTFTSATTGATSSVEIKDGASGGTALTAGAFAISGGQTAGALVTQDIEPNVLENGDLTLNGTSIRGAEAADDTASDTTAQTSDAAASGIAVAAAINDSSDVTGVSATVNATKVTGGDDNGADAVATSTSTIGDGTKGAAGSVGSIYVNGVETNDLVLTGDESRDRNAAIDAINAISGQTGVTAEDNGESITLSAADGRNISVAIDNKKAQNDAAGNVSTNFGNAVGLNAADKGIGEADITGTGATYENTAGTTNSTVTLTSAKAIEVGNGENGADELNAAGLTAGSFGGGEDGQFLKDIDISTFEGAQKAISAIDNAIGQIASQRADLGAVQNRMESTVSNLQITSENLNAANSRIRDADFAAETAELQRTNVLQQAGISILAQANARGQQVLSLLG